MASLIAFVSIFVESPYMDDVVQALSRLDKVVDLYEVTGEFDIVTVVSASDIEEFRDVLKNKIMKVKGVKSTVSSIVLKTHKGPKNSQGLRVQRRHLEPDFRRVSFCQPPEID